VSLPQADDLFRPTAGKQTEQKPAPPAEQVDGVDAANGADRADASGGKRRSSGRVRHDEKMTVYITSDELLDLEHARLALRRTHGLAVDRGRLVREAVALVLADLESNGDDSALVRRLREA